ncbi:CDC48 family AAA ATPase [Methanobacterium formicicum]|uniref:CDC48 family AAA ATPase n=1 Tax=Methanobacterium formicicum TaxID=2162 RepID=A0A089ZGY9_METFO|nr:CDC48 family AAA ATPase [Methanobacterium formicicum]AIS31493.1 cell division control protein Cdc48 [Methanobacterium formicicum]MBF4475725.1 CDC48 family AAA ATPase [Methanobacterium formicicum]MDH2658855.1 CDC48 family AAA ATPase [Methanobacterium formicicum]CEA13004.1 Cell division cycle protein 48 homolog MJ1156 [Methanobacterium formicicum]
MPDSGEIELRVAEALQQDVGKGMVRIDHELMTKIGAAPGDIVEIIGKRTIGAIAGNSYPADVGLEIIRMDGLTRSNAGTSIGEMITIRKTQPRMASKVVIAPAAKGMRIMASGDIIKRNLMGRAVTRGDVLALVSPRRTKETLREFPGSEDIFREFFEATTPFSLGEIKFTVVSTSPAGLVRINDSTVVEVRPEAVEVMEKKVPDVTYDDVGGLKKEMSKVREMIELPLRHPEIFDRLGIDPPKGILLHGAPGTGKTLLAKAVASESGSNFVAINGPEVMSKFVGEAEKKIREIFEEAAENAPTVIFIDEIDAIAPKREEVTGEVERRVVAQILALMDGLKERGKVIVIGATNRPDALDPALRRPGRFDREIELRVPDRDGRIEILEIHTRAMPLSDDVDINELAETTHGFVGADLAALCREAAMHALRRVLPDIDLQEQRIDPEILEKLFVTSNDFMDSMKSINPSALREVFIEVPNVHWEDIGGLDELKESLKEVVEWPLSNISSFQRIGIQPSKGILLFGPPGTGKTMLTKAVATESQANFISVKGSEILSKWFGESERKIAEIFKKAKQASPCIVFFDEIDAIAPIRGSAAGEPRVTERMVNTILSEMDGLEELRGVVVIGATNRPDLMDPALLRPGRFDEVVLVPPPDENARKEILKVHTGHMSLDEDVKLKELAKKTEGYSGADIEVLCRKAGMIALHEDMNIQKVSYRHFKEALKKINPSTTPKTKEYYQQIAQKLGRGLEPKKVREEFPREVA